MKKTYILENLDCANCAAKIEAKFNAHPQVEEAVITFATKQLRLTAQDPDSLIPELTALARTVEGEVEITERETSHHCHEGENCSCGHHDHHEDGCCCGHHDHQEESCGCGHQGHSHGEGCGCGHHDHDAHDHHGESEHAAPLWMGAALFVAGLILNH